MTIKQPIWRSDLVDAVMSSLRDPAALGTIYEAAGPQRLTQAELLTYMYALTSRTEEESTFKIKELMLDPKTMALAFFAETIKLGNLKIFHQTSLDRLERDSISDMPQGLPEITELAGVNLHTIDDKFPWEVRFPTILPNNFIFFIIDICFRLLPLICTPTTSMRHPMRRSQ